MFGMGFSEIMIVAVIAVLFLGPEKLPSAMVDIAKFFKSFKSGVNDVKSSFEQELKIQELKEDALEYKQKLDSTVTGVKKSVSFDEIQEIKSSTQIAQDSFKDIKESMKKVNDIKNDPLGIKDTIVKKSSDV